MISYRRPTKGCNQWAIVFFGTRRRLFSKGKIRELSDVLLYKIEPFVEKFPMVNRIKLEAFILIAIVFIFIIK